MEGISALPCSDESTSSHLDGSEYEPMAKTHASSNRNFSSRYSFMASYLPSHFQAKAPDREAHLTIAKISPFKLAIPNDSSSNHNSGLKSVCSLTELHSMVEFPEIGSRTTQREAHRWSSASSNMDFTDSSEQLESERVGPSYHNQGGGEFKCGLCERLLSHTSLWSSHRIVRNGDMPLTGVLSCSYVFYDDCLDQ